MDGENLVKFVRNSVKSYFEGKEINETVEGSGGVFVSIHKGSELRGCIGFIDSFNIKEAALSAAFSDPRFRSLKEEELDEVVFEVSVLGNLKEIKDVNEIKVGRDGLVIEKGNNKGLLLPQVAVEFNWDKEEFLDQCCLKAGLDDCKGAKIFKFSCDVFKEESPNGKVVKV